MVTQAISVVAQLSLPAETLSLLLITAGLGLSILEAFAPGAHFVVLGVSLLATGLVGLLLGTASPLVLSGLVVLFGSAALLGYREFDIYGTTGSEQTSDSNSLTGTYGRVTERVTPTQGQVKLDAGGFDPYYSARSVDDELTAGTEVVVVDPGGGNVLTVEPLVGGVDEIDRALATEQANRETTNSENEDPTPTPTPNSNMTQTDDTQSDEQRDSESESGLESESEREREREPDLS
ncbi:NfeD family protein [Haloquadratum walsbyi]|uniref:NfeD domain protein n=1 Tax=Haloquadratum walsbyi (strain DSM 16790 / HBSQ001) TaxID=362976 RepID=Q18JV1_HALWD|nr:NfeD family protein [Haloquadratum walsbyi]CAJ51703.1 NfeD domain protein [Haloquadratum walsbyi DSM 16790]